MIHHYWRLLFVISHYLYEFASIIFASLDIGEIKVLEALHIINDACTISIGKFGFSVGLEEGFHTTSTQ